jgi:hypothetical protein
MENVTFNETQFTNFFDPSINTSFGFDLAEVNQANVEAFNCIDNTIIPTNCTAQQLALI